MDYSIWNLYKYGLSKSLIKTILEETNSIFDLIITDKKTKILASTGRKHAINKALNLLKANQEIFDSFPFESPYILMEFGAPTSGLRRVVERNHIESIDQIKKMSVNEINNTMDTNMKATITKIKESIVKFEERKLNKKIIINNVIMYNVFISKKISLNELLLINEQLIEKFYSDFNISEDEIIDSLNELIIDNYISIHENEYYFPSNIYYNSEYDEIVVEKKIVYQEQISISLLDYLERDFEDKDILLFRLQGKTFEEIGQYYGITRERVRQRQGKIFKKMPEITEINKYKNIFEKFAFSKEEFVEIFDEKPEIYEFLQLSLNKGKKDAAQFIIESDKISGSKKVDYLEKHKYFLTRFGEIKRINKTEFVEEVLYKYREITFKIDEFYDIYSEEVQNYSHLNLEIENARSVDGIVSRSQYIISTFRRSFRYYDLTPTTDDELLEKLISSLDVGCYSMQKIFNENEELMAQLDIRDEYELHNLYKKREDLLNEDIKLKRTPEFIVGQIDKLEFISNLLMEHSGYELTEFIDNLYDNYGFRKNTMTSYVQTNFRSYINDNIIRYFDEAVDESKFNQIKLQLVKPIYLKTEILRIFNSIGVEFNTIILGELNYYMTGNIIFKKKFKSAYGAFSNVVLKSDIWRRGTSSIELSSEMSNYLSHMERNRKLVMLSEGVYAQTAFLEEKGIPLRLLKSYTQSIYDALPEKGYFSLYTLDKLGLTHSLVDYGFETIFYERLISTSDLFYPVTRNTPILFAKNIKHPATVNKFLEDEILNYEQGVNIFDFRDELKEKYSVEFEIYDIQNKLQKSGVYYSKSLEKLYVDKEDYLNEVYA